MKYLKGIVVQSPSRGNKIQRDVNIGVVDSMIANSSYLSDFDLNSVKKIVFDLKELVKSDEGGFIWGQEYIMIDSAPEISFCENDLDKEALPDVPTISLLNLMIEIQKIKEKYQNVVNLKNIVGKAFNIIKSNPDQNRRSHYSNIGFSVTIDDVYVTLVLLQKDFELTENEFVNQLNTDFY
ncbi:hypothetical protein [Flavobacterium piscis]|uniref:Uncharacterized protein n=1 Tax=Flavobacterium piscis TaxID=1114874 RepID=A0ABU1Y603_9FLAO|nr:hypothetical protein [Flavobacterium piscis]MDR7209661.1 hypothetical protein [Flavobacterium piscis]